jgi:tetratricopeptide (TPR) repeat protein
MPFGEAEDNDWDGLADVLAQDVEALGDSTRMPGAAYQSRLVIEGTRLPELGYQSRLATAEEGASPERYAIGDVIGDRYEVLAIHRGTMGVVYGTFDREMSLPRALKTFRHRFAANRPMRNLFKEEAATWVSLEKHPFIVRALLVELFEMQPYVITEYIRGQEGMAGDLRGWLGHPRLTLPVAVEMALQIAQGMQHATKKVPGLVHRDLKPANILVDDRGRALVTDFGLSHAAEGDAGTPAYMAPEQWRGEELDQRADLYAFGCILYEMLTGRRLFAAVSLDDWRSAHLSLTPVAPRSLKPELPTVLDDLVRRCLAKRTLARPGSWDEVVGILSDAFHEVTGQPAVLSFSAYEMTVDELVNASSSLARLFRFEAMLNLCDRALEINPKSAAAWLNKGLALDSLQRHDEALGCCDRAIEINPRSAVAWFKKGDLHRNRNRYDEAFACYDRTIALDPGNAAVWYTKGYALEDLGRHDDAFACYDRALEISPDNCGVLFGKGVALATLGRHEEAILCYERAIETNRRYTSGWSGKGEALVELGRYDEALACFDRALELDPGADCVWYQKGDALAGLKRYDEAVAAYDRELEANPDFKVVLLKKGKALHNLVRLTEAIACYDHALDLDPSGIWAAELRAAKDAATKAKRGVT